jgi:UDPglucose--hexose-1-phosphate uridylyltransferase
VTSFDLKDHPHRRFNPLTREWVLVSPHRTERPWLGQVENLPRETPPTYDPSCYMCPGNLRASGARNPRYQHTFVFDNDYPALLSNAPAGKVNAQDLIVASPESGVCRVLCFSPQHDLTVSRMEVESLKRVVDVWTEEHQQLGGLPSINYVQIFENSGSMMGASNPHPHCQIWASTSVPNEPGKEQQAQHDYHHFHQSCLLCDYLALERERGERLVCENQFFTALIPFWAVWPFETMVLARRHLGALPELISEERGALADILKRLTTRYDNLFQVSFPYSMGFHQVPTDKAAHPEWHLHAHFYPPLLRSATVRKFMVGYEMLGTPQRDITAETAAEWLRQVAEVHFRGRDREEIE